MSSDYTRTPGKERIQVRHDTAANWTAANPVLALGEPGLETDTGQIKYGDGVLAWTVLTYYGAGIYASYTQLAKNPDTLITGAITRDANGAATSAPVIWPDGAAGVYTADTVSAVFPGAVDAYHITHVGSPAVTYTQPLVTRDVNGAAITVPPIVVS
ncbi:MAG: hypothetical protein QOH56_2794 [Pseudonocardiales bacterium]|nr:hypothetical protein [Pseudonocardiales bacterium]